MALHPGPLTNNVPSNNVSTNKYSCASGEKNSHWRGKKDCSAQLAREGNHFPQAEKRG